MRGRWSWLIGIASVACADAEPPLASTEGPGGPGLAPFTPELIQVEARAVTCPDAGRRDRAFDAITYGGPEGANPPPYDLTGSGLAVGDYDGDGHLDVLVTRRSGARVLRGNGHGQMQPVDDLVGIALDGAVGASTADYDGDGDLDLYVFREDHDNVLLANDGTAHFTDVTAQAGLGGGELRTVSGSWGDIDGDGDLDLLVGNYGPLLDDVFAPVELTAEGDPNQLFENQGDGTFLDVSDRLPIEARDGHTFMTALIDVDGDMLPEALVIDDFGWLRPSRLLWNQGGTFVLDDGSAGIDTAFGGMGLGLGDVDGDGTVDLLQSSWRDLSLLVHYQGTWYEEAEARTLHVQQGPPHNQVFGWGAELVDIDVDGDTDAVVGYGHFVPYQGSLQQHDALYVQNEDGRFAEVGAFWEMDQDGVTRGVLAVDLNEDGWPDLIKSVLDTPPRAYLSRCSDEAWMVVKLRSATANRFAVGARIEAIAGDRRWVRWITAGSTGMFSGGPPEALFGFGDLDRLDALVITWPDGATTVLDAPDTRQVLQIRRG